MTQAAETTEARLKRLKMRSMRRGIKEMDIILAAFADAHLPQMPEPTLLVYDALLSENDQDIYQWVLGTAQIPPRYTELMAQIAAHAQSKRAQSDK